LQDPFTSRDFQKGVAGDVIRGAALSGVVLGLFQGLDVAAELGVGAAVLAITPGKLGDLSRTVGDLTWKAGVQFMDFWGKYGDVTTQTLAKTTRSLASSTGAASRAFMANVAFSKDRLSEDEIAEIELNVEQVLRESNEALEKANSKKRQNELNSRALLATRLEMEKKQKTKAKERASQLGEARLAEIRTKAGASARSAAWEQEVREKATLKVKAAEEEQARLAAIAARVAEETRRAEEGRLAVEAANAAKEEKARLAAAATKAAEEAQRAEEDRKMKAAAEKAKAKLVAEAAKAEAAKAEAAKAEAAKAEAAKAEAAKAEAAKAAEDTRLAEERAAKLAEEEGKKIAEAAQIAEEMKRAEEDRLAEEAAEEDEEDMYLDDDDWAASIELATQDIDGKVVGLEDVLIDEEKKAVWNKAGQLAKELSGDEDNDEEEEMEDDDDDEFLTPEYLAAQAKAARAAVEMFETERMAASAERKQEKEKWAQGMAVDAVAGLAEDLEQIAAAARAVVDKFDAHEEEEEDDEFEMFDMEALGAAARAAVDQMDAASSEDDFDDDFAGLDLEALGAAARAAVAKSQAMDSDDDDFAEYEEFDDIEYVEATDEPSPEGDEDVLEEFDIDALGAAARQAVDMFDARQAKPMKDWSKMKVADLKLECTARGLKATGKKAELVLLLEEADVATAPIEEEFGAFSPFVDDIDFDADEPSEAELMRLEENPIVYDDFEEEPTTKTATDVASMTVAELKAELKNRGLPIGGKKADLLERLKGIL
jgi:SAP domain